MRTELSFSWATSCTRGSWGAQAVGAVVNAGIEYNETDEKIIELIERYASRLEAVQLKSDLDQFKDPTTPSERRVTAAQRVGGFLYKAAGRASDAIVDKSIDALIKYVMGS